MNLETALSRYKDVHDRILPPLISGFTEKNLKESFLHLNPPLWILWHMARSEDFGINRLASDGHTEFDKNNWKEKLNISTHKMGSGMSKEEVYQMCEILNPNVLDNYRMAVYRHNVSVINQLQSEDLSTEWDDEYLNRVLFDEDHLDTSTKNILPVYQKKTRELSSTPWLHILFTILVNCLLFNS